MKNLNNKNEFEKDYFSIELSFLKRIIFRNKYLFSSFVLIFATLGWTYSFIKKPIFQGQFEIVLDVQKKNAGPNNSQLALLSNFNLGTNVSSLATEVGILESPLVLRPVYEYVMSEKIKINPEYNQINFISWKDNFLRIQLKEETSILKIIYQDHNKELIKPVLDKMSEAYQLYSGRTKKRNIKLTKNYLTSQVYEFRAKSNKSFERAQEYAIDNNLSFDLNLKPNNFNPRTLENTITNQFLTSVGFENSRKVFTDQINKINLQIEKIKDIGENYNNLQYIGIISADSNKSLMRKLTSIEEKLLDLQSKYKPNDKDILLMKKRKELAIKLLKEKTIGDLQTERLILQTKLDSISRPKEVILTFKQLLREAARQEKVLAKLEDQLQLTNLEAAKQDDPWELITEPYVDSANISNKNIFILFGFFAGAFLGLIAAILKEKNSGIVFEEEVLEEVFSSKIVEKVILNNNESIEIFNLFLQNFLDSFNNKTIKFFIVGEENSMILDFLKCINLDKYNLKVEKKLSKILDVDKLYILSSLESIKEKQIRYLAEKFTLLNIHVEGIILVDNLKSNEN